MLEEVETAVDGGRGANREFRLKFPDEIVTENLGGQLWFGAECLAAGTYHHHSVQIDRFSPSVVDPNTLNLDLVPNPGLPVFYQF